MEGEELDLELGTNEQALDLKCYHWTPFLSGVVPYCYQPLSSHPQPGSSAYEHSVDLVEEAIEKFEVVPDAYIDFQGGGLCQTAIGSDPATLRIFISTSGAQTQMSCDSAEEWSVDFGGAHSNARARIFHELGHATGFMHEFNRRAGDGEPGPNDCIDDPLLGGGGTGITEYDVFSVANSTYCHSNTWFSPMDLAGLAYVYPGATADRLGASPFSFRVGDGLLSGGGSGDPLEFAQRVAGIWAFHFSAAQWWRITPSGVGAASIGVGSSVTWGTALGGASEAQIMATFTDEFGRQRSTPITKVRQNRGLATALLVSALSRS